MNCIKIYGSPEYMYLDVTLSDILKTIDNVQDFWFKVLWVEASWKPGFIDSSKVYDCLFEKEGYNDVVFNYTEILELSAITNQIMEGYILVSSSIELLKEYDYMDEKHNDFEFDYILEIVDSSFWEISSKHSSYLKNIEKAFLQKQQ